MTTNKPHRETYEQRVIDAKLEEIREHEAKLFEKIKVYNAESDYFRRKYMKKEISELQGFYSRFCV